jgi:23S rRNA U2552 (ribose-2'-O)-methylase RlmE/FtsJ
LHTKKQEPLQILEIGLGTNNIDVMSNMGRFGKPGASLRAFRDFLPNAYIYGADIDKRILFQEERINTLFIDQTNIEILYSVKESFGNKKFDLIIDDGLHNSEANLNSIDFALDLLSANGVLIIEDIAEKDFVYYKLLSKLFENKYQIRFIKTKIACVCYLTSVNSDIHSYNH